MKIGKGISCAKKDEVIGTIKYIKTPQDVIKLIKEGNLSDKICLLTQAGATTLAPVFSKIAGVLCTSGSRGSHLAIMSREFEIPAYMSCNFVKELESLHNLRVKLTTIDGTIGSITQID